MKSAPRPIPLTGPLSAAELADIVDAIAVDWERFAEKYNGKVPALAVNMVLLFSVRQRISDMKSRPVLTEGAKRELKVLEYAVTDLLRDIKKVRRRQQQAGAGFHL